MAGKLASVFEIPKNAKPELGANVKKGYPMAAGTNVTPSIEIPTT